MLAAERLAREAHEGQERKFVGLPYVVHPARVAAVMASVGASDAVVAAAWLHDVLEDTGVPAEVIERVAGSEVLALVRELTNPSKESVGLSRAERKALDREHIALVSRDARMIKLADRADNLIGMVDAPPEFRALYLSESRALAEVLEGTHAGLEAALEAALRLVEESLE